MSKVIFTEMHEAIMLHYMLLVRQLARLSDSLLHIIRMHTRVEQGSVKAVQFFKGYSAHAQTELADIICQSKKICETLSLDFNETMEMGDIRYEEKMKEFLKRYPNDQWI
jgi:hypothetical protein